MGASVVPQQTVYSAALQDDIAVLDRGILTYTPINRLETGTSSSFEVVVTDVGRPSQNSEYVTIRAVNGMVVYQRDVPTRGSVGVEIVNCGDLTCKAESSARQLVLKRGATADWLWLITAGQPGSAEITLRVDTYDQGSQQVLSEEVINVPGTVLATAAFNRQQSHHIIAAAAHTGISVTETIGTLAGSLAAIAGVVGGIIAWRRRRKRTPSRAPEEHSQPNDQIEKPTASDGSPGVKGQES